MGNESPAASFETVTELPGVGASPEQLRMLSTRYHVAAEICRGGDVLEVACGSGMGLGALLPVARSVVGGDYDPALARTARRQYEGRAAILRLDAGALPLRSGACDAVLLLEAIYYLPDPNAFFREARRVLRPGGALLVVSANREWPLFNPSPFSRKYYSLSELGETMRAHGLAVETFAAFESAQRGWKDALFSVMRKIALGLNLIPKTMAGKERIKKLLFGRLDPLPAELAPDAYGVEPLVSVSSDRPVSGHKVLFAIGRVPSA